MINLSSLTGASRLLACVVACFALFGLQIAHGENLWEMRVCADPNYFPASSETQPGYENRIAAILADQMEADLTFVWTRRGTNMVQYHLRPGDCDVIMGVADGAEGMLTTIPYYRSPYVFLYRTALQADIRTLNDEALKTLRIGTYAYGIPHRALVEAGLGENVAIYPAEPRLGVPDFDSALLEHLQSGEIDVAILYGPQAGYFAAQHPGEWSVVPVSPEFVSLLQLFRIWTIGVRHGDEALRDRLNIALAERWDDIQAVFAEYNVPLASTPRPVVSRAAPQAGGADHLRVGVVLPFPTGNPAPTDVVAEGARIGAAMAEGALGGVTSEAGTTLEVFFASSPTAEAAERASQRLVGVEGVAVVVGGVGDGQAEALAHVAEDLQAPFFNIGGPASMVRHSSLAYTFGIDATTGMYVAALAEWFGPLGGNSWFVVHESTNQGRAMFEQATAAVAQRGGVVVGSAELEPGQGVYRDVLEEIENTSPDVVLALLPASAQEYFYIQYEGLGLDIPISGLPSPVTQTREFYLRLLQSAPRTGSGYRAALWETTLEDSGALALNESYIGRSGTPMDPVGWAAYAAVKIAVDAFGALKSVDGPALVEYLEQPDTRFEVGKSSTVAFGPHDHHLEQPLYVVELQEDAELRSSLGALLGLAKLVGEILPTR